jgi:hypothetical protein
MYTFSRTLQYLLLRTRQWYRYDKSKQDEFIAVRSRRTDGQQVCRQTKETASSA